jgi:two-component system C4-dicarboxylate transport sensor histidine kinase DctB
MIAALRQFWSRFVRPSGALALLGIPLCIAAAYAAYAITFRSQVEDLRKHGAQRLEFLAISLESTLEKYEYLPFMVSIQRDARALVAAPADGKLREELNVYLQLLKEQSRVAAIYLMEERGTTLATSNWREAGSFLGQNYGFRPYFRDALGGRAGRFFAVGATTGEPGYFLSSPIFDAGRRPIGVAAVKVSLDEIEDAWKRGGEKLVVADANGVIFISSIPGLKYRTLAALDPSVLEELKRTRQYGPHTPTPAAAPRDALEQSRAVGRLGWRMITFSPLEGATEVAWSAAAATGFAAAFVLLLLFYLRLRASRRQELAAARAELQSLNVALEERIEERTAELVNANLRLQGKVAELKDAQRILEATQSDLVQAGKLAVLGQMAAGVTHELNQPLTAMRTLADNAVKLLAGGRGAETRENLEEIAQLTERMGRIVAQLKTFSRKSKERWEPVTVGAALDKALLLVAARAQQAGVRVRREGEAAGALVLGDEVRLEQVFVNLVRNAIDALAGREDPLITLRVELGGGDKVCISVLDNGAGIPGEVLEHLFEPFFTTKAAGEGLGLGLAISSVIVRAMGGELAAENRAEGGAAFRVVLPRLVEEAYA